MKAWSACEDNNKVTNLKQFTDSVAVCATVGHITLYVDWQPNHSQN